MKKSTILLFAIFPLFLSAQNYNGPEEDIETILNHIKTFSKHVMAGDHEQIAAAYTEDGKIFPSGRKIISGQEGLQNYWALPEGISIVHHKVTPEEITISGDQAYDYGYYEGRTKLKDGTESSWQGKYVIVWKKVDDDWKIYLDIWNRVEEKE